MVIRSAVVFSLLLFGCAQRNYVGKTRTREVTSTVTYTGGSGESADAAVVINGVKKKSDIVAAEYRFITQKHGERGNGWNLAGQTVVREESEIFDVIEIQLQADSVRRIYYFDVSEFLWKEK